MTVHDNSNATTKIVRAKDLLDIEDGGVVELGDGAILNVESGGEIDVKSGGIINVESGAEFQIAGTDIAAELAALAGTTAAAADLDKIDGITNGTVTLSKAVVVDANKDITGFRDVTGTRNLDFPVWKNDAVTMSPLKWVDVTVTAALLDAAGTVAVIAGVSGDQYKIRELRLVGGGTSFAAGGDRLISLTDGTTVWTTIANADIESAPSATLTWGDAKVPFLTGTSDTASASAQAIRFQYSGGTTDHSATGSIKFSVCLEKVA
jgi:hypothetical protein